MADESEKKGVSPENNESIGHHGTGEHYLHRSGSSAGPAGGSKPAAAAGKAEKRSGAGPKAKKDETATRSEGGKAPAEAKAANKKKAPKKVKVSKSADGSGKANVKENGHGSRKNNDRSAAADPGNKNGETAKKTVHRSAKKDELDTSAITNAAGFSHEERRRKQTRRDLLRVGIVFLLIALIAGAAVLGYNYTIVKKISVTGSSVYGEAQLLSMSGIHPGKNIFFYSEKALKEAMNTIHDIRTVSVTKVLPNKINIIVSDIAPGAAIESSNGTYTYISDDGYVLSMGESDTNGLIVIHGMMGTGFALDTYIDKQIHSIRTVGAVRLIQAIRSSDIDGEVLSIDLSSSAYVSLGLKNNYTIVLGSLSTAPECIETAAEAYRRFLPVYPGGGTLQVFRGSTVVDFTPAS